MSLTSFYSGNIKSVIHEIFKNYGGDYGRFNRVVPIVSSDKTDLIVFSVLLYVLKTEFKLTFKEITGLLNRGMDTLYKHHNDLNVICKLYDANPKLIDEMHDYITQRLLDYIGGEQYA